MGHTAAVRRFVTCIAMACAPLCGSAFAAPDQPAENAESPTIRTTHGPVRGTEIDGIAEFLGIRYAAPPVDERRWRAPQPPESWSEPKDATHFGARCAQTLTLITFAEKSDREDCLFLNVYAPSDAATADRPVMVWLHGGGLVDGESDDYDPTWLVEKGNVIVVTINYRLNAFGFLPPSDAESQPRANYGLMDQQFALKWVQSNIGNFGGDPDNVTLFGESAGALSVLANMASPTAKGLFHRAIIESPARGQKLRLTQPSLGAVQERRDRFAAAVDCSEDTAACLRGRPTSALQPAAEKLTSSFIVDGRTLTQPLGDAFRSGDFNQVPIIIGSNKDEGRFSVAYKEITSGEAMTSADYEKALTEAYGEAAVDAIREQYPPADYNDPSVALAAVLTDSRISCPIDELNRDLAQRIPVYAYEFADRTAPFHFPDVSFPYGAAHTAELQYLFPEYHGARGLPKPLNDMQRALSETMIGYWTRFAETGSPKGPDAPEWPRYTDTQRDYQRLKLITPQTMTNAAYRASHRCDFWRNQS